MLHDSERQFPRSVVYICPGSRCDVVPYTFYSASRPGLILDVRHVHVTGYDPDQGADLLRLAGRLPLETENVEAVVIGGSAFSLAFTWGELLSRVAEASAEAGVPVLTDMMPVITQMRRRGAARVTVAHRLAGVPDEGIRNFFVSAGFDIPSVVKKPKTVSENLASSLTADALEATALVSEAVALDPAADSVVLLGGTWLVEAARSFLIDSGRQFFNNVTCLAEHFGAVETVDREPVR